MTTYRIHAVHQGRLVESFGLEAPDDAAAIAAAQARVRALPLEIWSGSRRVATVEPRWRVSG